MRPIAICFLMLMFAACGGGGGGSTPDTPPPPLSPDGGSQPAPAPDDSPGGSAVNGFEHRSFVEAPGDVVNPERGFFDWIDLEEADQYGAVRGKGFALAYTEITLKDFLDAVPVSRMIQVHGHKDHLS